MTSRGWPLSLRAYRLATQLASPLAVTLLHLRALQGKEDRKRLSERFGFASLDRPAGIVIWLHGISVGECLSLLPLAVAFTQSDPPCTVLITSGTRAAAASMADRAPPGVLHQYAPIDTPKAVDRFFRHWRPALGVIAESELWPNLIRSAETRGIRLALVSAKLSAGSYRRWRRLGSAARAILGGFSLVLARDHATAAKLGDLGIAVAGLADLKFGAAKLPVASAELLRLKASLADRRVVVAVSTHPGEDQLVLECFLQSQALAVHGLLIIVPRHPDRGPDVERMVVSKGQSVSRRTAGGAPNGVRVYVADTLGELGLWYRLADLAIIGGSLIPGVGGHNPLEAARLNTPFVVGPHVDAWPIYGELVRLGATHIAASPTALTAVIDRCVLSPGERFAMAEAAHRFVVTGDEQAQAAIALIVGMLKP